MTTDHFAKTPAGRSETFAYLTGLITAGLIGIALLGFIIHLVGFPVIKQKIRESLPGYNPYQSIIEVPGPVLHDLTESRAVFSNAGNPTQQAGHDTILVHPDAELGYALNPNTHIYADVLNSAEPFNVDPPVLYRLQTLEQLSPAVRDYIDAESRQAFSYGIDANGIRTTLPSVDSDRKLLIVGDSVAFGVGVDDDATMASRLQAKLGDHYRVVNAGVGGYTGRQVFKMADKLSREQRFAGLIYLACQNDFYAEGNDWNAEMRAVLAQFKSIEDRFEHKPIVVLETYLEYNLRDFFGEQGWGKRKLGRTDALRGATREQSAELGFGYADWSDDVSAFRQRERGLFAPFALYVDHTHLSPRGNELMADRLLALLRQGGYKALR